MAKKTITIIIDDGMPEKEDNVLHPNNGWVDGIDRCASCPNDPRNGGSGICYCAIPSMYGPNRITCCCV